MMKTVLLKNGFLVTPQRLMRSDIVLRNGRDPRIEFVSDKTDFDEVVDITGKYVVPGFVDIHFHGYNLFEFTTGLYDPKSWRPVELSAYLDNDTVEQNNSAQKWLSGNAPASNAQRYCPAQWQGSRLAGIQD